MAGDFPVLIQPGAGACLDDDDDDDDDDNFDSVTMMKQLLPFEFASNISIKLNFPLLSFHSPPCTQVLLLWSLLEPSLEE